VKTSGCHWYVSQCIVVCHAVSHYLTRVLLLFVWIKLSKLLRESRTKKKEELFNGLEEGCLSHGSVIVYVWRQRDTEVVAENLMASDIEGGVVIYHGGMDSGARAKAQSKV